MDFSQFNWAGTNLAEYPRLAGENRDSARLQRAVDAHPHGVILIPGGVYALDRPVSITNYCSLWLAKEAVLRAAAPMEYLIDWNGGMDNLFGDYGMFIKGGTFDGAAMSGGVRLRNIHHFTMSESWFRDCTVGLTVGDRADYKNYELCASNLYLRNTVGIPDSVGINIPSHGDHYLDSIIVVDYQTGFCLNCGSTCLSKCHSWVTDLIPDMSRTIAFDLAGGGFNTFTDCYVDTSHIGIRLRAGHCRFQNTFGYHNGRYGGSEHVFISCETDKPFYMDGGSFIGWPGANDIFFRGRITPSIHMHWIDTENLSGTEVLAACGERY